MRCYYGNAYRRSIPQVLMINLRHRHSKRSAEMPHHTFDHVSFLFERACISNPEFQA